MRAAKRVRTAASSSSRTRNDDGRIDGRTELPRCLPSVPWQRSGANREGMSGLAPVRHTPRSLPQRPHDLTGHDSDRQETRSVQSRGESSIRITVAPAAPRRAQHQDGTATAPTPAPASSHCACHMTPTSDMALERPRRRAPPQASQPASKRTQEKRKVVGWPEDQTGRRGGTGTGRASIRTSGRLIGYEGARTFGSNSDSGSHPRESFMGEGEAA